MSTNQQISMRRVALALPVNPSEPGRPRPRPARRTAPLTPNYLAYLLVLCCIQITAAQTALPPAATEWRVTGVGSCTAAGCHGGGPTGRLTGSEYNVWITRDPHARAYSVLFDERSQRMVELLAGVGNDEARMTNDRESTESSFDIRHSSFPPTPAHRDQRCLACHSMTDAPPRDPLIDILSDGVGCESCHGPAEGWLAEHVDGKLSPETKRQLGLWDTDRLLTRTETCVRCHVGAPGRDVNHDLIAAGHPRLQFEMGAYHAALPKHWDDAADRARVGPDFDALLWALGQACSSQVAAEQLANRAEGKGGKGVRNLFASMEEKVPDTFSAPFSASAWPEFAEWSCAACHHDLRDDQARQQQLADADALSGRRIAWDTWNHHTTRDHAVDVIRAFGIQSNEASEIETTLGSIGDLMQGLIPNRRQVAEKAAHASQLLGQWAASLERSHLDRRRLDGLSAVLVRRHTQRPISDWSTAAQLYDALASLHETRLSYAAAADAGTDAELTRAIRRLYTELAARQLGDTNYQFDPPAVQQQLINVADLLPAEEGQQ